MKLLTATTTQTIYLTLKEQTPSNAVNWFLEFESVSTNVKHVCVGNEQISNDRYTSFGIDTNDNAPSDGNVNITQQGYYILRVYWRIAESSPNPDRLIETKLVNFVKPSPVEPTIVTDSNNEQVIYYEA